MRERLVLQALENENLPKLKKLTAILSSTEETKVILNRLARRNSGLTTQMSRAWDRRVVEKIVHLVLEVDQQSLAVLSRCGYAPHFGLGKARFYEASSRARTGVGGGASKGAASTATKCASRAETADKKVERKQKEPGE